MREDLLSGVEDALADSPKASWGRSLEHSGSQHISCFPSDSAEDSASFVDFLHLMRRLLDVNFAGIAELSWIPKRVVLKTRRMLVGARVLLHSCSPQVSCEDAVTLAWWGSGTFIVLDVIVGLNAPPLTVEVYEWRSRSL